MDGLGYYDFLQKDTCFISFSRSGIYYNNFQTKDIVEIANENFKGESDLFSDYLKEIKDSSFMELNTIYLENVIGKTKNIILDKVKDCLKEILSKYKNHNYIIIIPTGWDYGIREDLIRPLLIEAGLLNRNDHESRLLFFTNFESTFSFMQSPTLNTATYPMVKHMLLNGRRYIMCGINFNNENIISVDLDLFSAHYPSITSFDTCYVPKSSKSVSFDIQYDFNMKNVILLYLKSKGYVDYSTIAKETMKYLKTTLKDQRDQYIDFDCKNLLDEINGRFIFQRLKKEDVEYIKSLSLMDIFFQDNFDSIKKHLSHYLDKLLKDDINNKNISFIGTYSPDNIRGNYDTLYVIKFLLSKWVNQFMRRYCDERFDNKNTATYKACLNRVIDYTYRGATNLAGQHIRNSVSQRPVLVIQRNKIKDDRISQVQMFEDSKPSHIINIVMSFDTICFSFAYTDITRCVKKSTSFSKCKIKPLKRVFVQSSIYQRRTLQIPKRIKAFFKYFLELYPMCEKDIETPNKDLRSRDGFIEVYDLIFDDKRGKIQKKTDLNGFFTKQKDDNEILQVRESKYINFFLILYLRFIIEMIKAKLDDILGPNRSENKVGYVISVEKKLLDNVFVSKKDLRQLLFNNDMFHEANKNEKLRIVTHGEGILPIIQQQTKVNFRLKSYFILVQLHENYIRLTLNQVVRTSSPEEDNVASIIAQDKTIEIENVNDTICKHLLSYIKANNDINYCNLHEEERFNLYSLHKHTYLLKILKRWLSKSLSSWGELLNMDAMNTISFNSTCSCNIKLSLRSVIDSGLISVLQNITTIIAGAVTNKDIFGYYTVDNIFVIGNIFNLKQNFRSIYFNILQWKLEESFYLKEKDCNIFMLKEELCRLLQPTIREMPYLYDSFVNGFPCHVSKDTFIIYTSGHKIRLKNVGYISNPTILIRKGDPIPDTGFVKLFELDFRKSKYGHIYINICKLDNSKPGSLYFEICENQNSIMPQIAKLEIIYKSHEHVLQFSVTMDETNYYKGYEPTKTQFYRVPQELTIAYV